MYKHLLVPTDGTRLSDKAIRTAVALAQTLGAKITSLHVAPTYTSAITGYEIAPAMAFSPAEYRASIARVSKTALDKIWKAARAAQVPCVTTGLTDDRPWDAIVRTAKKKKCDLIVMASHGRGGLSGLILGSETTKVLTHCKMPVLVVR
jgi:nucleotide-binding universal stress UspA family protein